MRALNLPRGGLEIREVVAEASRALALLDATRLEELAMACQALNRAAGQDVASDASPLAGRNGQEISQEISEGISRENSQTTVQALAHEAREAAGDMMAFGRILEATRANLTVMRRLRQLKNGRIEYSEAQARGWTSSEPDYGDN